MLLDLPMSRSDIADYLGLAIETACRVLARLVNLRLIAIHGPHQIEIIDMQALVTITVEGFDHAPGRLLRSAASALRHPDSRRPWAR